MTRYNREILVPYLQSVCALELAIRKLEGKSRALQKRIQECDRGYRNPFPYTPDDKPRMTLGSVLSMLLGGLFAFGGVIIIGDSVFFGLMEFALAALLIGWPFIAMKDADAENERIHAEHRSRLQEYNEIDDANRKLKALVPQIQSELKVCEAEKIEVRKTIQRVYSANIIPSRYRNIYVAIYLYDWFSTGQADDLDAALNMFVLEEIKDRLDTIIRNQGEMILNQYMMLSNQHRSLEQQEAHDRMMLGKLDQMIATDQERNVYLEMIEGNTQATAYFAAADYIRKI